MTNDWSTRVLALMPLLALGWLWANHHLGPSFGYPGAITTTLAAITMALGVVKWLLDKPQLDVRAKWLRDRLDNKVTWPLIVASYLAAALIGLSVTSVVVVPESTEMFSKVTLTPVHRSADVSEERGKANGEPVRFVVTTNPFGRTFRLETDGYVPKVAEVFPVTGLRVSSSRDLSRSPTVLLRLSDLALNMFKDQQGGELVVLKGPAFSASAPIARTRDASWAFLLGRDIVVPDAIRAQWNTDLELLEVRELKHRAQHLVGWRTPKLIPLQPNLSLAPGMQLRVELRNSAQNLRGE